MKLDKGMVELFIGIVGINWITWTIVIGVVYGNWWFGSVMLILPVGMVLAMGLLNDE